MMTMAIGVTACSGKNDTQTKNEQDMVKSTESVTQAPATTVPVSEAAGAEKKTDEEVLNDCLAMLGKTDEEANVYFDGGEQNYTEDKSTLIGRNYEFQLYGETVSASTMYSDKGMANTIVIELNANDASYYKGELTKLYGEPLKDDKTPGEGGAVMTMWEKDGKEIQLFDSNGSINLQMVLPEGQ